jgi:hypothetical protein
MMRFVATCETETHWDIAGRLQVCFQDVWVAVCVFELTEACVMLHACYTAPCS